MGAITITFEEEGQEPLKYQIPAAISERIQRYVDEDKVPRWDVLKTDAGDVPTATMVSRWGGSKAAFALAKMQEHIIGPILAQYPLPEVDVLRAKKAEIERQIAEAEAAIPIGQVPDLPRDGKSE